MLSRLASDAWVMRRLVYVDRASRYLREPSAYSTPSARDDFPDPDTPATATTSPSGTSTSTFLRLCTLAPRTSMWSGAPRPPLPDMIALGTSIARGRLNG